MAKLLMISGDTALAEGKRGAFYNTLEEFHKHWERIDIICPRKQMANGKWQMEIFGNVFIHPSPWPKIFQPFWILKKGKDIFKKERFDIVTAHEYPPFYNGIGARLLWNKIHVPYVLEIMHIPGLPRSANAKEWTYKILSKIFIRFTVRRAAKVRVINQNQVPKFLQSSGVPVDKLIYIPAFYIDLGIFKPQLDAVKEYDLIFIGRLEKNKGIKLFLEAVKKSDLKGVIVGDGSLRKDIQSKIKQWNLKIGMHGWAKDSQEVANLLNRSKILVMSSYNEGGPRVVLEAMACGVPVLATPVGIIPDIINDKNEIVNWNSEDIAYKAKKLLSDRALYEKSRQGGLAISQRFERSSEIKNYADKLKSLISGGKHSLLIITQKVDQNDQLLGFSIGWFYNFAQKFNSIHILCLEKGEFSLPENVKVISLGKDRGVSKLGQLFNFYKNIWLLRKEYDAVFVFMNAIWVVMGSWSWRLLHKKVYFWYAHKTITWKHRLAEKFADGIFTSTPEGFRLKSKKIMVIGQGIDTNLFKPDIDKRPDHLSILSVGRIAPIKNYEVLLYAAKILDDRRTAFHITIIGEPTFPKDVEYDEKLKKMVLDLGLDGKVSFIGKVINKDLPVYYQSSHIFINLGKTGSLDKTIVEAMASGATVISSNDAAIKFLPKELVVSGDDPKRLAEKIEEVFGQDYSHQLRQYVIENHSLNNLVEKISSHITKNL